MKKIWILLSLGMLVLVGDVRAEDEPVMINKDGLVRNSLDPLAKELKFFDAQSKNETNSKDDRDTASALFKEGKQALLNICQYKRNGPSASGVSVGNATTECQNAADAVLAKMKKFKLKNVSTPNAPAKTPGPWKAAQPGKSLKVSSFSTSRKQGALPNAK